MRHRKAGRQLRRTSEQKLALMRSLASSLFERGAIETTEAKAKELRPFVEKLITKARSGTLHDRRLLGRHIQKRETAEGRRIPPDRFVEQYFQAREVVNRIKATFGKEVRVDLLLKNIDNSTRTYHAGVDQIDGHVPERYSREDVERIARGG